MYSLSRQSITDMSIQNGVQFDEGQLDQWMSTTHGSQGRVAGSRLAGEQIPGEGEKIPVKIGYPKQKANEDAIHKANEELRLANWNCKRSWQR